MSACECGRAAGHAGMCARRCSVQGCPDPHKASGYCGAHYKRWNRHGDPLAGGERAPLELHIEDIEWMVETGEHFEGAAARLGCKPATLEKHLGRAGRGDLLTRLKARRQAVA